MAIDLAWPRFRRSRTGRRVPVDCRHRCSCVRPCARSDPPAGYRGEGCADSRDKGAGRSENAERRDPGRPCARLAAADSAGLAGFSRRPIGAGSAGRRHTRSDCLKGLIAAARRDFRPRFSPALRSTRIRLRALRRVRWYCTAADKQRNHISASELNRRTTNEIPRRRDPAEQSCRFGVECADGQHC